MNHFREKQHIYICLLEMYGDNFELKPLTKSKDKLGENSNNYK